eukprot:1159047-Pelagomonas_calceolata.AAC.10
MQSECASLPSYVPFVHAGSQTQTQTDPEALPISRPNKPTAHSPARDKANGPTTTGLQQPSLGGDASPSPPPNADRKRPRAQAGEQAACQQLQGMGAGEHVGAFSKRRAQEVGFQERQDGKAPIRQYSPRLQRNAQPSVLHKQQQQQQQQQQIPQPSPPPRQQQQQEPQHRPSSRSPFPVLRRVHTKSYALRKRELVAAQQRLRGPQPPVMTVLNPITGRLQLSSPGGAGQMKGKISGKGSGKGTPSTRTSCDPTHRPAYGAASVSPPAGNKPNTLGAGMKISGLGLGTSLPPLQHGQQQQQLLKAAASPSPPFASAANGQHGGTPTPAARHGHPSISSRTPSPLSRHPTTPLSSNPKPSPEAGAGARAAAAAAAPKTSECAVGDSKRGSSTPTGA